MLTNQRPRQSLGDFVVASYDLGLCIADDDSIAAELAARRLERVLTRRGNLRLTAAIAQLARELQPMNAPAVAPRSIVFAELR